MTTIPAPSSFDLYSTMPGVEVATAELQAACDCLQAALLAKAQAVDVGPKVLNALLKEHVVPVLKKHADFGTFDGEPRYVVVNWLKKVVVKNRLVTEWAWFDISEALCI